MYSAAQWLLELGQIDILEMSTPAKFSSELLQQSCALISLIIMVSSWNVFIFHDKDADAVLIFAV